MKTKNHSTNKQDNSSPKGRSLEKDFKRLIDDENVQMEKRNMDVKLVPIFLTHHFISSKLAVNDNFSFDEINSRAIKICWSSYMHLKLKLRLESSL